MLSDFFFRDFFVMKNSSCWLIVQICLCPTLVPVCVGMNSNSSRFKAFYLNHDITVFLMLKILLEFVQLCFRTIAAARLAEKIRFNERDCRN